jgi:YfiH family protein
MDKSGRDDDSSAYFRFRNLSSFPELFHVITPRRRFNRVLNLSYTVGRDAAIVDECREVLFEDLGLEPDTVVSGQQVHGDEIAIVDSAVGARGAVGGRPALRSTDGLVTTSEGLYLLALFADCVPLLLYDPRRKAVGLVHAGWRGTMAQIATKAVRTMQEGFGSSPEDIRVGIGPSIGPCCYTVGPEVVEAFRLSTVSLNAIVSSGGDGKTFLNLWEANRLSLLQVGVRPENIELAEVCTACHVDRFFSHRSEVTEEGRFGALIGLKMQNTRADGT